MLKNYIKTAWRNLVNNKFSSAINIGGLAVGMTVTMLIGLWIYDELSFDKYHKNYDRIGMIWGGGTDPETSNVEGTTAMQLPMGATLKNSYGHYFKHVLMAWWVGDYTLSDGNRKIAQKGEFIEEGAPDMLSLKMLKGSYSSLHDPHSVILSRSAAEAMFGKDDPVNKNIRIDNRMEVVVTGVYEDIPGNTTFHGVQFFAPWSLWMLSNDWVKNNESNWDNRSFNIYVQLQPNVTWETAKAGVRNLYIEHSPKAYLEEIVKYKPFVQLYPMSKWHLYSKFVNGEPAEGAITFVWMFGIIGIFVLLLACINFMNLSTARSEKRAKEVGIRKAIGSLKGQLIRQFLSESFIVVLLAFVFSLLLVGISLSWFNGIADKTMSLPFRNPLFWTAAVAFMLFTGFMAGLYPAFYLSSFKPIKVLKGGFKAGRFASMPRKVLVVVQFAVSVTLIIGTIVVYRQIQYARNRPIGYDRQGLVSVPLNDPNYKGKSEVLKSELLNTGVVTDVAFSAAPLTQVWHNSGGFTWRGRNPEKDNDFAMCFISYDFGKTIGWQFVAGRDFSKDFSTDSAGLIINETAAKYMGLSNPIGEVIKGEKSDGGTDDTRRIIGVVKDIVMQSPYEPVKQTLFFLDKNNEAANLINIKLKSGVNAGDAIAKIGTVFKKVVPSAIFDYKFVDAEYNIKFKQEERIGTLAGFFAGFAIFISCLGLFGLASFVAEQRTREIGIRKVIGASVFDLWRMLSKDFVILVVISCLIAIPVAYYYMHEWLQKYQYRAPISWWIFAAAIGGALLITLLTVSSQAIKAAIANPVKSLRSE